MSGSESNLLARPIACELQPMGATAQVIPQSEELAQDDNTELATKPLAPTTLRFRTYQTP